MNDTKAVRVIERLAKLDADRGRDLGRQVLFVGEQLAQRLAAHQLDYQVALFGLVLRDVVHLHDAGVLDLGHGARLAGEALPDLFVLTQVAMDDLDRDLAP